MNRLSMDDLKQSGYFLDIDIRFAEFISRSSHQQDPYVCLAAALVSNACGNGDACLEITASAGRDLAAPAENPVRCPDPDPWLERLRAHPAVGAPGDCLPLVLDDKGRLYLYRYWEYEQRLAVDILQRAAAETTDVDKFRLTQGIRRLFPAPPSPKTTDWQKVAAAISVMKRFCVITGGPGTGKTYTVAKLLALLVEQGVSRIALAAPTGKAAARMAESILRAKAAMDCRSDILDAIPSETFTIHRLLKPIPGSPYFRHHSDNPLPLDVLVVDEASMVDLALLSKLVQALPAEARLIILGDKDQLASVEAGSVLGDICNRARQNCQDRQFRTRIETITEAPVHCSEAVVAAKSGLQNHIVILENSRRFSAAGGIAAFSRAVNLGDTDAAAAQLVRGTDRSVSWQPASSPNQLYRLLSTPILRRFRSCLGRNDPLETMAHLERYQILCAHKKGPFGSDSINRFAETELRRRGIIPHGRSPWYRGRPVLIIRNDYLLSLFNGDIGITLPDVSGDSEELWVYFQDPTGGIRGIPPYRLPEHETVYAMTVHKSQGSEFDHVALVLPDRESPVLTRELIYTAVTRARKSVTLYGPEPVIRSGIAARIDRTSGLRDMLWGN